MFWWARFILFALLSAFFLVFGIQEMIRAYAGNHPVIFLGSFFSSSFIILISGTVLVGCIWRIVDRIRGSRDVPEDQPPRG